MLVLKQDGNPIVGILFTILSVLKVRVCLLRQHGQFICERVSYNLNPLTQMKCRPTNMVEKTYWRTDGLTGGM